MTEGRPRRRSDRFRTNEEAAQWLEAYLLERVVEMVQGKPQLITLYEVLLTALNAASDRAMTPPWQEEGDCTC